MEMRQCLFNTCSNNCCAYCKLHHCSMTVKQMKTKECLKKQCWHLVKNDRHQYWKQREIAKNKKKERKLMMDAYVARFAVSKGA